MKPNKGRPLKVVHRKDNSGIRLTDKRNAMAVVNRLPSREAAKIMELFINSMSGRFSPAVAHICTECGFGDKKQYYRGRKRLEGLGYITVDPNEAIIYVEFDALLRDFAEIKKAVVPHGNDSKQDGSAKPEVISSIECSGRSRKDCIELMSSITSKALTTYGLIYETACNYLGMYYPDPNVLWPCLMDFAKDLNIETEDTQAVRIADKKTYAFPTPKEKTTETYSHHTEKECRTLMKLVAEQKEAEETDVFDYACNYICDAYPDPDELWAFIYEHFTDVLGKEQKDIHEASVPQAEPDDEFEW